MPSPASDVRAIVIGDGLTKECLGSEQPFAASAQNVGASEIDRLLGRGKAYGNGPLPAFLRAVVDASGTRGPRLVLLHDEGHFADVFDPIVARATVMAAPHDLIPSRDLAAEISGRGDTPVLVVGCHTERRVFALASYLRNVLGCADVAVSPHLVGSATQAAHFAALRHNFAGIGVRVLLDLEEAARYVGVDPASVAALGCHPPDILPHETRDALAESQRRILEMLCLNWTRAEVRPLAGGFSGSLLLLANGWKGQARTEPLVLKVDSFSQMRRELGGYHQVKDFFGKHVPTFGYPVAAGDLVGVGMELAAMEGRPRTLQDAFDDADTDEALNRFLRRLDKSLALLSDKLYRNTRETTWVVPYRAFGLHAEKQMTRLIDNATLILGYVGDALPAKGRPDPTRLAKLLRLIAGNPDGVDSEVCLAHGDLNFANIIGDDADNLWFIDWTHCAHTPVELDFAKLENDTKFVMSKAFDASDLPRLRQLEEYLLEQKIPGDANNLPERLKFVKWDLRFRRVLETTRRVRQACFALKGAEDWLVYRIALLRYAVHTLSFDKRRNRGECEPPQLMHALYSVEALIYDLVADDFHLKIRSERPAGYPARQRISIDEAPWKLDREGYRPPYYVSAAVLDSDRSRNDAGWADPEDFAIVRDEPRVRAAKSHDAEGRPQNPRGRTGLAGRGLLGLWGANLSVSAIVIRTGPDSGDLEILLGGKEDLGGLEVPKGFVLHDENAECAVRRILLAEAGWVSDDSPARIVFDGYTYDSRQTDHAWVESRVFLLLPEHTPALLAPGGEFEEVRWRPLDAETINRVPAGQARFIRDCVPQLVEAGRLDTAAADRLLASTG